MGHVLPVEVLPRGPESCALQYDCDLQGRVKNRLLFLDAEFQPRDSMYTPTIYSAGDIKSPYT